MEYPISHEDVVENLSEGVIAVDPELRVRVFNQAAEKIMEVSRSYVLGRPVGEVLRREGGLVKVLSETLAGKLFTEYEERLYRKFSGPIPVAITTSQVLSSDGALAGAVAILKDMSGIKSLEADELRKERLAILGAFAANLAHEIKNPLSGIRGAAQLLTRKIADTSANPYMEIIIKEVDRLDRILKDTLDFARPAKLIKKELNVHRVLDSVVPLLGEGFPDLLKRAYDPSLPPVSGDESKLSQVFLNLLKNAKEAIGEGGRVHMMTRMVTEFHVSGGKMAVVEIRDEGCGIKPEDMERIFMPFYTTKPGGSGLGMAITLKIIKEHGGFLEVDSEPGKGTRVSVYLPIFEG